MYWGDGRYRVIGKYEEQQYRNFNWFITLRPCACRFIFVVLDKFAEFKISLLIVKYRKFLLCEPGLLF